MWHWIGQLLQLLRRSNMQVDPTTRTVLQRLQFSCVHQVLEHEKRGPDEPWQPIDCRLADR